MKATFQLNSRMEVESFSREQMIVVKLKSLEDWALHLQLLMKHKVLECLSKPLLKRFYQRHYTTMTELFALLEPQAPCLLDIFSVQHQILAIHISLGPCLKILSSKSKVVRRRRKPLTKT